MNADTAIKHCKQLSRQYGIVNPPTLTPMKYSRVGKSCILGYYDDNQNCIAINKYVMELWSSHQIVDVIKHELMHARCYQEFGHGGHGKHFHILCDLYGICGDTRRAHKKGE